MPAGTCGESRMLKAVFGLWLRGCTAQRIREGEELGKHNLKYLVDKVKCGKPLVNYLFREAGFIGY